MADGPEPIELWCATELEIETFSFHWTIKNFSTLSAECIVSPIFKGGPKSGHEWKLMVHPKNKFEDTEHLAVYLILSGFGAGGETVDRKVQAHFQITLLDATGRPLKPAASMYPFREFKKDTGWGTSNLLKNTDLAELIKDDTLKLHCRVWAEGEPRHRVGQNAATSNPDEVKRRAYEGLSSNLQELLGDSNFADFALSTPTKTFMVHKAILSARSSVFRAMLNADMVESATNTIEIPDFEEDVVKAMLDYIYTGKTPDLSEKAIDLLQVSDKYDLGGLKEECSMALVRNLTVENAVDVLVLAHLHNASSLKGKVIDFISGLVNYTHKADVKETESFKNLAPPNPNWTLLVDLYLSQ